MDEREFQRDMEHMRKRIKATARHILANWHQWEAEAEQLAQIEQSHEAYEAEMLRRLEDALWNH